MQFSAQEPVLARAFSRPKCGITAIILGRAAERLQGDPYPYPERFLVGNAVVRAQRPGDFGLTAGNHVFLWRTV